ncbi:unnamed protein product [Prunus brigantina]
MKRTRRGTTEASSSRPNRQCPTASTRRQRAAPQDHFEDTTEVEDVVPTHDSNADAEVVDPRCIQVSVHAATNLSLNGFNQFSCMYSRAF